MWPYRWGSALCVSLTLKLRLVCWLLSMLSRVIELRELRQAIHLSGVQYTMSIILPPKIIKTKQMCENQCWLCRIFYGMCDVSVTKVIWNLKLHTCTCITQATTCNKILKSLERWNHWWVYSVIILSWLKGRQFLNKIRKICHNFYQSIIYTCPIASLAWICSLREFYRMLFR